MCTLNKTKINFAVWMNKVFKMHLHYTMGEETERNSEENLLPTRLGSQSKLPRYLNLSISYLSFRNGLDLHKSGFSGLTNLPFWNGKPRISLISGSTYSEFSLNLLSEMGSWSCRCQVRSIAIIWVCTIAFVWSAYTPLMLRSLSIIFTIIIFLNHPFPYELNYNN